MEEFITEQNIALAGLLVMIVFGCIAAGWAVYTHFSKSGKKTIINNQIDIEPLVSSLKESEVEKQTLRASLERANADIAALRAKHPDWQEEIDKIVEKFNAGEEKEAQQASHALDALIENSLSELQSARAQKASLDANLFHPFDPFGALPLREKAANFAPENFVYQVEYGRVLQQLSKFAEARQVYSYAKTLAEKGGDRRALFVALDGIGNVEVENSNWQAAREAYAESLALARALLAEVPTPQAKRDLSLSLNNLGDVEKADSNWQAAREAFAESLELRRALLDELPTPQAKRDLSVSLERLGDVEVADRNWQAAREAYAESLELDRALLEVVPTPQAKRDVMVSLHRLAALDCAAGEKAAAGRLIEEARGRMDDLHPSHQEETRSAFDALAANCGLD